jgi:lysylphosphatidylglycerol synthetase-like protein (DUF2156 family)
MSRVAARMPVRAHRSSRPGSPTSRWIAAWPGGALLGVLNGTARQMLYAERTGDRTAHQISTATMIALLAAYFVALDRRWPLQTRARALQAGSAWLVLTAMFEFGFGHWVAKEEWSELLADYDLAHGRLWALVLAWTALGPLAVVEVRS